MGNRFDLLFMLLFIVLVREKPLWCAYSTDYTRKIFCRKMEKTRPMKEEVDGEVFFSRQSQHFPL